MSFASQAESSEIEPEHSRNSSEDNVLVSAGNITQPTEGKTKKGTLFVFCSKLLFVSKQLSKNRLFYFLQIKQMVLQKHQHECV